MKTMTVLLMAGLVMASFSAHSLDYYSDIRPVMEEKCLGCHTSEGIGFSLEDAEQAYLMRHAISSAVAERRMPPWLAEAGHQEYADDISLNREEMKLFAEWAAAGYPKGRPGDSSERAPLSEPFAADLSMEVLPGRSYLPDQARADDYRCFVLDWPLDEPGYVTGFNALAGNMEIVHHLVLYAAFPEVADRYQALSEEEEGEGYQCFGGAVPDRLGIPEERKAYEAEFPNGVARLNEGAFWLGHWAPGTEGYAFPEDTGIRMEPGMALIVQMHYYSAYAPGERDEGTRMEFLLSGEVAQPAFYLPLTNTDWLRAGENESLVIPPGEQASYAVSRSLDSILNEAARISRVDEDQIGALTIHSANLHMHRFGHSGEISLLDGNGRKEVLLSVPRWDVGWQRNFVFSDPKHFPREALPDTHLGVECRFENHEEDPVYGGFSSDEEMCFNFALIAVESK